MRDIRDVIIIGSGPAAYTAAIYAGRANLRPIVYEGVDIGGALMTTSEVENFPGFPSGVQGPELMGFMREQAERFGAELELKRVENIDFGDGVHTITDDAGEQVSSRSIIIATGSEHRKLGVTNEDRFYGKGVSTCATCDGYFFKDREVFVVGGGDSAAEEVLSLSRVASSVTLVHRRGEMRASKIMQDRVIADSKVKTLWNTEVVGMMGGDSLEALALRNLETGKEFVQATAGLFVAVGSIPRSELLRGKLELDADGYVKVRYPSTATKIAGVFAAGDVVDRHYRQAITASASGCAAALDADRYLSTQAS